MKNLFLFVFFFTFINLSFSQGCNSDVSVCTSGEAGPFIFDQNTFGPPADFADPQECSTGSFGNDAGFGFILLQITESGALNLLIDGNSNSGYVDVIVYNIPNGINPCDAVLDQNNEIACNYATDQVGCTQFGNDFPCFSSIEAPMVTAGQTIMVIAHDYSTENTSFTLELGPSGAQTGGPDGTIEPITTNVCLDAVPFQLIAENMGGSWTGNGVSNSGMFNPQNAGVGTHTIDYEIGIAPCNASATTTITVADCSVPSCTVTASNNTPICLGQTFDLLANTVPNALSYTWSGNGFTSSQQNPSGIIAPTTLGTFDYTVLVTVLGATCQSTTTITVNSLPDATINPVSNQICHDAPAFQLLSNDNTGIWSGNGTNSAGLFTPLNAGIGLHTITYTVGSGSCMSTQTSLINVVDCNIPPCTITASTSTICEGQSFNLFASTVSGALNYTWTGNGFSSSLQNPSNISIPLAAGNYNFIVTANTALTTCFSSVNLVVNPLPQVFAGNDTLICQGKSITLKASGASNYTWNNGVLNNVSFSPSNSKIYTVIGTDANSCSSQDIINVGIIPLTPITFIEDTLSGCSPLNVNFTNTTLGATNSEWTFNGQNPMFGEDITKEFAGISGCFNVRLTTTVNGCQNSLTKNELICVNLNPIASFYIVENQINDFESNLLFYNHSQFGTSFTWDFGDGSEDSGSFETSHDYLMNDSNEYIITLIAKTELGCADTVYQKFQFIEKVSYFIPNTFTPNGDKHNSIFIPVFSSTLDETKFSMEIYNRWGELIFESLNSEIGWDGTYGSKIVDTGFYHWKIEFSSQEDPEKRILNGTVFLNH
ncbi:MAG: gliding motility-associated C-terminal domain-containing protein [Bacteroidota bacterium]